MSDATTNGKEGATDPSLRLSPRHADLLGLDRIELLDPAEDFHEASRLSSQLVDPVASTTSSVLHAPAVHAATARAVKRHVGARCLALPHPSLGDTTLATALATRRSVGGTSPAELPFEDLASLLHAGYGVTGETEPATRSRRTAPSGGALYPLEIYVATQRVTAVAPSLCHYDPSRHCLEQLRTLALPCELDPITPSVELLATSAAVLVVAASFWRSRIKYGVRGYRFTLLEAGHVAQNVLLAASALDLPALPLGGFFDRRVDELVGLDGVRESSLYLLLVWGRGA